MEMLPASVEAALDAAAAPSFSSVVAVVFSFALLLTMREIKKAWRQNKRKWIEVLI